MGKIVKAPPGAKPWPAANVPRNAREPNPALSAGSPSRKPRIFPCRFTFAGLLHVVAILVVVYVVWGCVHDRLLPGSWSRPMAYSGDANGFLTFLRAASELDYLPFFSRTNFRLGAPYTANWNDYPMYESLLTFLLGLIARWSNLGIASTFGVVLSHLTSAFSFYFCCRLLRFRREWAAAGALLWTFTYYHVTRASGLGHLVLSYDYTVPLGIVCCWLLAASKRIRIGGWAFWLCLGVGFVTRDEQSLQPQHVGTVRLSGDGAAIPALPAQSRIGGRRARAGGECGRISRRQYQYVLVSGCARGQRGGYGPGLPST